MKASAAFSEFEVGREGGMMLEVDALARYIAVQLVAVGVRIPRESVAAVSAAVLAEAVRISVEWLEVEARF